MIRNIPDPGIHPIWPNGIIFHQPRFPWNKGEIRSSPTFWGEVVWGRYNLICKTPQKMDQTTGNATPILVSRFLGKFLTFELTKSKKLRNEMIYIIRLWRRYDIQNLLHVNETSFVLCLLSLSNVTSYYHDLLSWSNSCFILSTRTPGKKNDSMGFCLGKIFLDVQLGFANVWCLEKAPNIFPEWWWKMVLNPMGSNPWK